MKYNIITEVKVRINKVGYQYPKRELIKKLYYNLCGNNAYILLDMSHVQKT